MRTKRIPESRAYARAVGHARPPGPHQRARPAGETRSSRPGAARGSGGGRAATRARRTARGPEYSGSPAAPIGRQPRREVAVQVDAATVESGARRAAVRVQVRDHDQPAADGRAAVAARRWRRVDAGALVAVDAAESQDQRTAGLDSTRAPDSVRSPGEDRPPLRRAADRHLDSALGGRRSAPRHVRAARSGSAPARDRARTRSRARRAPSIKRAAARVAARPLRPRPATARPRRRSPAIATVGELVPGPVSATASGATDAPTSCGLGVDRRHRLVPLGHGERRAGVRLEPEHVHVACGDVVEVDARPPRPPTVSSACTKGCSRPS